MLLISRTEAKLAAASEEIASKFNVQTKYTVVDFAHADQATWKRTAAVMATLDVGILFNNVGLSYDHPEYLEQLSEQQIRDMVEVNITSVNQASSQSHHWLTILSAVKASSTGQFNSVLWYADDFDSSASHEGPQKGCHCQHWQCIRLSGPSMSIDQCVCWYQGQHVDFASLPSNRYGTG